MTNKEAAEHFAALPPDESADILLINDDTGGSEKYTLNPTSEADLERSIDKDERDDSMLEMVHIFLKW